MTLEQAIQNVQVVLEAYKGNRGEHITIDQSFKMILESLKKDDIKKTK